MAAGDALVAALTTDEGAHLTIDLDTRRRGGSPRRSTRGHRRRWLGFRRSASGARTASVGEGGSIPFLAALTQGFPGTQFVATGVLGPHSNAHGPNESLHIPMAKAVTHAVAALLADG